MYHRYGGGKCISRAIIVHTTQFRQTSGNRIVITNRHVPKSYNSNSKTEQHCSNLFTATASGSRQHKRHNQNQSARIQLSRHRQQFTSPPRRPPLAKAPAAPMASPKQTELYWKWPWSMTTSEGWKMAIKNVVVPADETTQILVLKNLASASRESERMVRVNLIDKKGASSSQTAKKCGKELATGNRNRPRT